MWRSSNSNSISDLEYSIIAYFLSIIAFSFSVFVLLEKLSVNLEDIVLIIACIIIISVIIYYYIINET